MKKKELEIFLQKIPDFEKPKPGLEQYITPAGIVADIIFIAFQMGDIENKIVLDLGCGTGIFSVGACVAGAKKVIGIDLDEDAIKTAKQFADENKLKIDFIVKDVKNVDILCDTVIMNPPFGAQKSNINADRRFIEKAFEKANVIYSLHLTKTVPFIKKMVSSLKGTIDFTKNYSFPIKHSQSFHAKKVVFFDVTLLRILTKGN
jgi:putative methylase